jgi:hypothetical protein
MVRRGRASRAGADDDHVGVPVGAQGGHQVLEAGVGERS